MEQLATFAKHLLDSKLSDFKVKQEFQHSSKFELYVAPKSKFAALRSGLCCLLLYFAFQDYQSAS